MEYFKRLEKRYGKQWDYAIAMINSGDNELLNFYFTEVKKNKNKEIIKLCRKVLRERNITVGTSKNFEELKTKTCKHRNYRRIELPSNIKHITYRENGNGLCENCEKIELKYRIEELLTIGLRRAKDTTPTIWNYSQWLIEFAKNVNLIQPLDIKKIKKERGKEFGNDKTEKVTIDKITRLLQNQRPAINIARRYDEHLRKNRKGIK